MNPFFILYLQDPIIPVPSAFDISFVFPDTLVVNRPPSFNHVINLRRVSHNVFSSAKRLPHQPSQHQQRQHQRSNNEIKRTTTLKGPFTTASSMVMPELHLSSPHPGGRNANTEKKIPEIGGLRHEPSRHDQWKQYGEGSRQKVYSSVDSDAERDGTGSMFSYTA